MSKIADFFRSHHIQLALATGVSIIVLAYVSKRVLPTPMDTLAMAFPPFVATLAEAFIAKHKDTVLGTAWIWVVAVLLATAAVIGWYLI